MLFDPAPKDSRDDFFDREKEIEKIKSLSSPITLILGLRRTGKSSIIKISIKELNLPNIYIDLRKFEEKYYISYKDFLLEIEHEVNKLIRKFPSILDFLKRIEGVSVMGNQVKLKWGGEKKLNFSYLLEALDNWAEDKIILVLDEAQELINLRGANLLYPLAYSFDNLRKVKIIMSGSKMRLLYRYLKIDDPKSPLFGRAVNEIELKPFNKEMSTEFLKRGFEELNIEFKDHQRVYEELGGIPGWLTYFGYHFYQTRNFDEALKKTIEKAKELINEEFNNFLTKRPIAKERYIIIMKKIASECSKWSEIKMTLEAHEGREISDSEIYNYLNSLIEASWIIKEGNTYCPAEKLIAKTFK